MRLGLLSAHAICTLELLEGIIESMPVEGEWFENEDTLADFVPNHVYSWISNVYSGDGSSVRTLPTLPPG